MSKWTAEGKRKLYREAMDKWGREAQVRMAVEEMAELSVELLHILRGKDLMGNGVAVGIADVEIMLEQLRLMFSNLDIDKIKEEKLTRLYNRLASMGDLVL